MLRSFIKVTLICSLLFPVVTFSQDLAALKSLNISRTDIKKSLKQLHEMGKLSDEQFKQASKELDAMSDQKMNALVKKGKQMGIDMATQQGYQMDLYKQLEGLEKKSE